MIPICLHVERLPAVPPGLDVCESCMESGGTWLHLRQCLVCGRTGCCDSSPRKHASAHFHETGHEVMESLEEDEDWSWCFACEQNLRRVGEGGWRTVDPFFEAGLSFARRLAHETGAIETEPDEMTPEGFPIGAWAATYRARRRDDELDADAVAALEGLPGWHW